MKGIDIALRRLRPLCLHIRTTDALIAPSIRTFASFSSKAAAAAPNRIYDPVRSPTELDTLTLLSASSRRALITLWTASWCPSCRTITPLVRSFIEDGVAEDLGGVEFAEVEFDSPTLGDLARRYMITSIPTLLAFGRQEAQMQTRLTKVDEMKDLEFLRRWIEDQARSGGKGGKGGNSVLGNLFGFGGRKS